MNKEEKQAIENLKLRVTNNGFSLYDGTTNIFNLKDIEIALNLISKLQKENEELKEELFVERETHISKYSIKNKIKEVEEYITGKRSSYKHLSIDEALIVLHTLKELLGDDE